MENGIIHHFNCESYECACAHIIHIFQRSARIHASCTLAVNQVCNKMFSVFDANPHIYMCLHTQRPSVCWFIVEKAPTALCLFVWKIFLYFPLPKPNLYRHCNNNNNDGHSDNISLPSKMLMQTSMCVRAPVCMCVCVRMVWKKCSNGNARIYLNVLKWVCVRVFALISFHRSNTGNRVERKKVEQMKSEEEENTTTSSNSSSSSKSKSKKTTLVNN